METYRVTAAGPPISCLPPLPPDNLIEPSPSPILKSKTMKNNNLVMNSVVARNVGRLALSLSGNGNSYGGSLSAYYLYIYNLKNERDEETCIIIPMLFIHKRKKGIIYIRIFIHEIP
jgi:hypothetical protein